MLTAQAASGAHQSASDVLVGDVYLCRANRTWSCRCCEPVTRATKSPYSANNTIRMLTVPHSISPTPLENFQDPVAWQIAAPGHRSGLVGSLLLFRARAAEIHSRGHWSWCTPPGADRISGRWMSAAALRALDGYRPALDTLALYAQDRTAATGAVCRAVGGLVAQQVGRSPRR